MMQVLGESLFPPRWGGRPLAVLAAETVKNETSPDTRVRFNNAAFIRLPIYSCILNFG